MVLLSGHYVKHLQIAKTDYWPDLHWFPLMFWHNRIKNVQTNAFWMRWMCKDFIEFGGHENHTCYHFENREDQNLWLNPAQYSDYWYLIGVLDDKKPEVLDWIRMLEDRFCHQLFHATALLDNYWFSNWSAISLMWSHCLFTFFPLIKQKFHLQLFTVQSQNLTTNRGWKTNP